MTLDLTTMQCLFVAQDEHYRCVLPCPAISRVLFKRAAQKEAPAAAVIKSWGHIYRARSGSKPRHFSTFRSHPSGGKLVGKSVVTMDSEGAVAHIVPMDTSLWAYP